MEHFYHYTSIETLLLYILPEKRLRFSSIKETNDPEESYDDQLFLSTIDGADSYLKALSQRLKKHARILSLTQDNEQYKGYEKPRMWAQYSNHHRGVCLILNEDKLLKAFRENYQDIFHYDGPISYDMNDERKKRSFDAYNISIPIREIDKHIESYVDIFYFSKHPDWAQENEYRLLVRSNQDCFIPLDGILEAIILGVEAEPYLNKPISLVCADFVLKPKILKLDYINNQYRLRDISI